MVHGRWNPSRKSDPRHSSSTCFYLFSVPFSKKFNLLSVDLNPSGLTKRPGINDLKARGIPHWQHNDEFEKYVLSMLGQYILASEYYSQQFSCLRIFCRMDVGVYRRGDQVCYFINEFDHSTNTGLFPCDDSHNQLQTAFVDLAWTLEHAVKSGYLERGGLGKTPVPD